MKRILAMALALGLAGGLCGCQTALNIDDQAYVLAIGLDVTQSDALQFTFQVPVVQPQQSEEGGASSRQYAVYRQEAPNVSAAIQQVNTNFGGRLNVSHINFLVVSEAVLRQQGVAALQSLCAEGNQYLLSAKVIAASCTAGDLLLSMDAGNDVSLVQLQSNIFARQKETGSFPLRSLYEVLEATAAGQGGILVARSNGVKMATADEEQNDYAQGGVSLIGGVALGGEGQVLALDVAETLAVQLAQGSFVRAVWPQAGEPVWTLRSSGVPDTQIAWEGESPTVRQTLYLEGPAGVEEQLQHEVAAALQRCMRAGIDPAGYGKLMLQRCFTQQEWENINWTQSMKEAPVRVSVKAILS